MKHEAFERIVVALDESEALELVRLLKPSLGYLKVGLDLAKGALLRKSKWHLSKTKPLSRGEQ